MSFLSSVGAFFGLEADYEAKASALSFQTVQLPLPNSPETISALLAADLAQGGILNAGVSAVHACVRIISEGLALPPCYLHKVSSSGKTLATNHPLYPLLNSVSNSRQTSFEAREMMARHAAYSGNGYAYLNRSKRDGSVMEIIPLEIGMVSTMVDPTVIGSPVSYYVNGQLTDAANIFHLKGPSFQSWQGENISATAGLAIKLASQLEQFGSNLFVNGGRPGGIVTPADGTLTAEQYHQLASIWAASNQGVNNAHKVAFLSSALKFTPFGQTADESQWTEARKFQIQEICRYFRVSPTKAFLQDGSQSYASVEQQHIAHDGDTDAVWRERYMQSANKCLLSASERASGYSVTLDDRAIKRGTTAGERLAYWSAGIASGIFTQNEARIGEGFDPSDDPEADRLKIAANIGGAPKSPDDSTVDEEPKNKN